MSGAEYDPARCDLCGSGESREAIRLSSGRALRSDRTLVPFDLHKLECERCGLVRDARPLGPGDLEAYYAHEYTAKLQPGEHVFYTREGPVPRSHLLADWMVKGLGGPGEAAWRDARRAVELGSGSGVLLRELRARFPQLELVGVEPGSSVAGFAREQGQLVYGSLGEAGEGFDLAFSVAVIEHVASPTAFLRAMKRCLRPQGSLFLCQPTQDVQSYDVLFVDHLHHFGSGHLRAYARKCGFVERGLAVGHQWMPNFSLHLLEATAETPSFDWSGPPLTTQSGRSAQRVAEDMRQLDALLERLRASGRRVAVFGLQEVYWLARAYSALDDFPLVCGLDDDPTKPEYRLLGFPVLAPERCSEWAVDDVLLAVNKVYYPQLQARLLPLGVSVHQVLH